MGIGPDSPAGRLHRVDQGNRGDQGDRVDQVDTARDWLRRHGIDAGASAGADLRVGAHLRAGADLGAASGGAGGCEPEVEVEVETSAEPGQPQAPSSRPSPRSAARPEDADVDPEEVARRIVLRKLAAQARTRAELERALQGRSVPEDAAAAVLDRMGEIGLVDDAGFARDWVASRQQRRHLSRSALRRELQTKGVDREVIDDALAGVAGADERRAALDLARRRASAMAGLPPEVAYRRLGGVLARRGFSASVTAGVLAEVLGCSED